MKIFCNWLGFLAVATGAAHFIFAIDSNSIATDQSTFDKDTTKKTSDKGRASYLWEKRVSPPYPYQQYHHYKPIVTPVQPSNMYPGRSFVLFCNKTFTASACYSLRFLQTHNLRLTSVSGIDHSKSDFRPTASSRIASVAGTGDQRLERHGSPKKSYGYSGGGTETHYYPAQPLPYYPPTKEQSFSFGRFGFFKPLFFILILPFFLLLFFTAIVFVAAASSSSTAAGLTQQQQQQQDSNNNNNNANNNNDNNNNAIVFSTGTGTFVITINATGRANDGERFSLFKNAAPLFNWHNTYRALPSMTLNETLLLT